MLIAAAPLAAAILGILVYVLASNAKVAEVGRALMWTGMLVVLLVLAHHTIKL